MSPAPPATLDRLLTAIRSRLLIQRWLSAAIWSTAAAAFAYGVGSIIGLPQGVTVWIAIGCCGAVLGAVTYGSRKRRPLTKPALAVFTEERLGLAQRFSTAVETDPSTGPVTAALHQEVAELAGAVDPVTIVPARVPRNGLIAAAFGVLVALVGLTTPEGARTLVATIPTTADASRIRVETVHALADSVAEAASGTSDPLLAALAEALRSLASDAVSVGSSDITDRTTLEDLLGTLARATGSGLTGEQLASGLEEASRRLQPSTRHDADAPGSEAPLTTVVTEIGTDTPMELEDLLARLGGDQPAMSSVAADAGTDASSGVERAPGTVSTDYLAGAQQALSDQARAPVSPDMAAAIIGASEDSSAGASQLAGRGSQALEGEPGAIASPDAAELVALSGRVRDEGRQVEMELSPSGDGGTGGAEKVVLGHWVRSPEAMVRADYVPAAYRRVAGRYFLPSQDTVRTGAASGS